MGGVQSEAYLLHDLDRFFGRKLRALVNQAAKVLALDVLHGDELHTIALAQVINADHVAVCDPVRQQ